LVNIFRETDSKILNKSITFKNKVYSAYYSGVPIDYETNPSNYILVLKVKKSLFDTYYIEDLQVKIKPIALICNPCPQRE
jgi:hypothetical protein